MSLRRTLAALTLGTALTLTLPLGAAAPAMAAPVSLVADSVRSTGPGRIEARGNVIVLYQGVRLMASGIRYDRAADRLEIDGPITLIQASGDTIILASSAELSTDLRNGIMQSARVVLDQQMQIAAAELNRVNGRYTQAAKVVASSCEVCIARPTPLWEIRAREVVHDAEKQQLYFTNAQFRVMGLPVFWLPHMRLPDPTLERATGLLTPRLLTSSRVGNGLRLPYFIKMGDHRDLTVTPLLTTKSRTVELRYRQAFTKGQIEFNGAISDDKLLPGKTRWYLFGSGQFEVGHEFKLDFGIEQVSDEGYLSDYNYTDADRLESFVALSRTRRDQYINAELTQFSTLRASEIPISTQLPFGQAELLYERRFDNVLGGAGFWQFNSDAYWRESDADPSGRDGARLGFAGEWAHDWVLGGLVAELKGALTADAFWVNQDTSQDWDHARITPTAAITLRYPMSRTTAGGALEVIEPVAQLAWSDHFGARVPNEDSYLTEFDETNLFDLSRFAGQDQQEDGPRAALGLSWTRFDPSGWTFTLAAGRVFHGKGQNDFSDVSGLSGAASDWLIAGQAQLADRFALQGRVLVDSDLDVSKSEILAMYQSDRITFATGHIWVDADPAERPAPIHEWSWDSTFQINDNWRASADWRYDLGLDNLTKAGLGLEYSNECVTVDLSLSRRFTSSTSVKPTTNVGLGVTLNGIGGKRGPRGGTCGR